MVHTGQLVRSAREDAGLSQAELADRLGTTQPVVSRWERGHDEPRLSTIAKIARVCDLRLDVRLVDDSVDRAQIRQQLALDPEQRLASVVNVSRTLAELRPAR